MTTQRGQSTQRNQPQRHRDTERSRVARRPAKPAEDLGRRLAAAGDAQSFLCAVRTIRVLCGYRSLCLSVSVANPLRELEALRAL